MQKLLFLSVSELSGIRNGGQNGSYKNLKLLQNFYDVDIVSFAKIKENKIRKINKNYYELPFPSNKVKVLFNNFFFYSGNLSFDNEKEILKLIKNNKYRVIFLDSSYFGRIIKKIKKIDPEIIILTFFHNIEYFYIEGIKKEKKGILNLLWNIKLLSTIYNEKKAILDSDHIFLLNKRDKKQLENKYKIKRDINFLPVSFEDKGKNLIKNKKGSYLLFVGALFYANYNGIKWFIDNVMSMLPNKRLVIVGKNFEKCRLNLEKENVEVIGTVENIEPYYLNASCIVAPIFQGAGMKVKIAEALMYGKTIYGTTEAFEGYEINYNKVGGVCNTDTEFIKKILENDAEVYNEYSRKVFLEKYSFESSKIKFKEFLKTKIDQ